VTIGPPAGPGVSEGSLEHAPPTVDPTWALRLLLEWMELLASIEPLP
jgi:hypothetical protein